MVLDFYYRTTEGQSPMDNSCVPEDERLMHASHFMGYDNLLGENTFFNIDSNNLRDTVVSAKSHCINRIRQMIVSLALFHKMDADTSLENILAKKYTGKRILLLEHNSPFAAIFSFFCVKHGVSLVTSEYFGSSYVSGDRVNNILHVNIEKTHFADAYFDLIMHTDVFEHVSDAPAGEKEIARILTPGGLNIFTAPYDYTGTDDDVYAEIKEGNIQYNKEPVYHDDPIAPDGRCLVFRVFSLPAMKKRFNALQCDFYCNYLHSFYMGILGNNAYSFVACKR